MRRLLFVGIILAILGGVDLAAKVVAENKIEDKARTGAGAGAAAEAGIHSFPFVPRALLSGDVGAVEVHITGYRAGPLRVASIDIDLGEVEVDRGRLRRGQVSVTRIRQAAVKVELAASDLTAALGLPITIEDGTVGVTVAGQRIAITPTVSAAGSLQFKALQLAARVLPLDRIGVIGCTSVEVQVRLDRLRIECATREIPPVLIRAGSNLGR